MNRFFLNLFLAMIYSFPSLLFAQAPNLRSASGFALFTAAGAFNAAGASTIVTGDAGTNVGAYNAFPPGILIGQSHVADAVSASAATDVLLAYGSVSKTTCGRVISTTLGSGQTLLPNVYCLGAASTINGELILDGKGDPSSLFIFKINGALASTVNSRVKLINSASLCNVYWQVNGQVDLGENSIFQGTILANGAINILDGAKLYGRALSQAGAISLQNNIVTIAQQAMPANISANGSVNLCTGGSVLLSGNIDGIWSTGATTPTITVSVAGDYFVTNKANCGNAVSNHIIVTVSPNPVCTISGKSVICPGQSTKLCVPAGAASYLWSNAATTNCITVNAAGIYSVTVTNTAGCKSTCSQAVTVSPNPVCTITGSSVICPGKSTKLCVPAGAASYLWSNGATTNCITVNAAGTYSVTVTNTAGCISTCSQAVTVSPYPVCSITGNCAICPGQSTQLCAPAGRVKYLWSNGAITQCINVSVAGTYYVTITNTNGHKSTCSKTVRVIPLPICTITGNSTICKGQSTKLCAPAGCIKYLKYLWSNGATTQCITVSVAGTYSLTVTNAAGCTSTCTKTVKVIPLPVCNITGNFIICNGKSTQLCAPAGCVKYLWSNGATTECITVLVAGTYSVTLTNAAGCTSTCCTKVSNYAASIAVSSTRNQTPVTGKLSAKAYPNPFSSNTIIELTNVQPNLRTVVELYNSTSRKIATLYDKQVKQGGLYQIPLNAAKLSGGIYFLKIVSGDEIINREIILSK